jgi:hypothetical protein
VGRVAAVRTRGFGLKACRCRTPQVAIEQRSADRVVVNRSELRGRDSIGIDPCASLGIISADCGGALNRPIVILLGDAVSPLVPLSAEVTGVALVVATIAAVCASMITQRS